MLDTPRGSHTARGLHAAGSMRLVAAMPEAMTMPAASETIAHPLNFDADFSRTWTALGGDAARGRLHALHPALPGDEGAMTGFAFAVLGRLAAAGIGAGIGTEASRPVLWVQDARARGEAGRPYGLGFQAFGFDPRQFVIVSTKTALDALAAVEIGLEMGGLAGVLAELPATLPADMLALGKRLALRAERSRTPCLLLHTSARPVPAPVATRWEIASAPAVAVGGWRAPTPAANLTLVKNRFGPTGRWAAPLNRSGVLDKGVSDARTPSFSPGFSPGFSSGLPLNLSPGVSSALSQRVVSPSADGAGAAPARTITEWAAPGRTTTERAA
jgi:protein ImuA